MRIDPVKPIKKPGTGQQPEVNYRQRAAIIFVFIGVFYFFFKVIF